MLSKKFSCKWFSFGIWRKQTFRYWPLWASYLAIWLLTAPQMYGNYYVYDKVTGLDYTTYRFGEVLMDSLPAACGLMAVYAIFIAMAVYSYLYNHRSVNLFHALPVRRETLFATNFVTGLSFLVVPNFILTAYFGLLQMMRGGTEDLVPLLTWFGVTTLFAIFFFGLATLCATATATILMLPVLYGIFNFLVVVIETMLRWLASMFLWGVSGGHVQYTKWSPLAYLMAEGFQDTGHQCVEWLDYGMHIKAYVRFADWEYALLVALAGVACTAFALWLYRRWHSEAAGDIIAFSFLRPVFTYAWTAGCSLVLGSFFFVILGEGSILGWLFGYDGYVYDYDASGIAAIFFTLCMLLGGTVGYFSAKMLHKKSFRVFSKKDWKGYGAFVAALLALVLCIRLDLFGIEGWTPDADEVYAMWVDNERVDAAQYEDAIRIHQTILDQRESLRQQVMEDYDYEKEYISYVPFRYELRSGQVVQRQYPLLINYDLVRDSDSPVSMLYALLESEELRLQRSGLADFGTPTYAKVYTVSLPDEDGAYIENDFMVDEQAELNALVAALKQDITAGTIGSSDFFSRLLDYNEKYGPDGSFRADISLQSSRGEDLKFYINETCPNTWAWVQAELAEYLAQEESDASVQDQTAGVN